LDKKLGGRQSLFCLPINCLKSDIYIIYNNCQKAVKIGTDSMALEEK